MSLNYLTIYKHLNSNVARQALRSAVVVNSARKFENRTFQTAPIGINNKFHANNVPKQTSTTHIVRNAVRIHFINSINVQNSNVVAQRNINIGGGWIFKVNHFNFASFKQHSLLYLVALVSATFWLLHLSVA